MQIAQSHTKRQPENITPMINVVFLLLIFFLMTAQLSSPAPFEVTPPDSGSQTPADGEFELYLDAQGQLGFEDALGDAALIALEHAYTRACADTGCFGALNQPTILLRADAGADASRVPALLRQLAERRMTRVQLATRPSTGGME